MVTFFAYLIIGLFAAFFLGAFALGILVLGYAIGLPVAGIIKIFSRKP